MSSTTNLLGTLRVKVNLIAQDNLKMIFFFSNQNILFFLVSQGKHMALVLLMSIHKYVFKKQ